MDEDVDLREIDLRDKPDEFVQLSPTGKVPMLVEDDFVLYESQVINDYLIEDLGWTDAYASDRKLRYRQKVSMKQWDSTVLGPYYSGLSDPEQLQEAREDIMPELKYLSEVVRASGGRTESAFAFHFAPFWARMNWLEEHSDLPSWVRTVDGLADWLDGAVEEPVIQETLPDREYAIRQYRDVYVNPDAGA